MEEKMEDYLCRYAKNQSNFKFFGGQIKVIFAIVNFCRKLYEKPNEQVASDPATSSTSASIQNSTTTLRRRAVVDGKIPSFSCEVITFLMVRNSFS